MFIQPLLTSTLPLALAVVREFVLPAFNTTNLTVLLWSPSGGFSYLSALELLTSIPDNVTLNATSTAGNGSLYGALTNSTTALETTYRINCGGPAIPPDGDQLGRSWQGDWSYSQDSTHLSTNRTIAVTNVAPGWLAEGVYMSQRMTGDGNTTGGTQVLSYTLVAEPSAKVCGSDFGFISCLSKGSQQALLWLSLVPPCQLAPYFLHPPRSLSILYLENCCQLLARG